MQTRPASANDLAVIAALNGRYETKWFGAPEQSEAEVAEQLGWAAPLAENSLLVFDTARLVGAGLRFGENISLEIDPDVEPGPVLAVLLPWFAERPGTVEILSSDEAALAVAQRQGWTHVKSTFELIREVTPDLEIPEPVWPQGVAARGFDAADAEAVHRLIYVDAGWAEIPGHPARDYDDWRSIFVTEHTVPEQQVIAWRGDRIVGVAMGRIWDDGTGWIAQLASAKDERGKGLGRALLSHALRLRVQTGARSLGLSVQSPNRGALKMYLAAGLAIDREFRTLAAPERD
ncbi:MAG TPA: GNAT family N-acetyltransferase [Jatrophihabitans sp.]|nr:GNAT family N-acetyltransferase [Jatrophihabitans sp.]